MIVNETVKNGKVIDRATFDPVAGRVKHEVDSGAGLVVIEDRAMTALELAHIAATENESTLEQRVRQALTANATFLGVAAPTAVQQLAQIRALTRQVSALIRRDIDDYTVVD